MELDRVMTQRNLVTIEAAKLYLQSKDMVFAPIDSEFIDCPMCGGCGKVVRDAV